MKKGLILSVCLLLIIGLLGVGVSYSLWNISISQDKVNTAMTSCFDITYSSETTAINLEKQYPISNEAGSKLVPYTFKITNNCDVNAYYKINLETLNTSNIDTKFMKASLNNENPKIISNYDDTNTSLKEGNVANTLKSGYLPAGGSVSFDLRVWLDCDTTVNDIKNDGTDKWVGKIVVISSPVTEDEINKACQSHGGDLIEGGECRKYYVKLNNISNQNETIFKGYNRVINEDESITASTEGLTYAGGSSISVYFSNGMASNHAFFYSIDILKIESKLLVSSNKLLEFTRCTIENGSSYWPRTEVITSSDDINIHSGIFTTNPGFNNFYIESYAWAEFSFKNMMLIDLTLMFGEGNEPSKEWCDKYLDRYIEYNLEGTLVPIKEIGEPVKTSYYDVINLF